MQHSEKTGLMHRRKAGILRPQGAVPLDSVEEGFEGGFVLEAGTNAVALFRHDEFGFDGVTRDDAERRVFAVDEIDDVEVVGDEFSICIKLRHVGVGDTP